MTVHWILFLVFWGRVAGDCDANTGPPGGLECVSFAEYNNAYQWGTCLTDAYIRQKSGAAYQCKSTKCVMSLPMYD
ncbi:hypothetical protein DPMN_178972 [Dreissena polymorpha]|uniref:Secreted protein n=1 Tax=Dreissena polymorpha TaxID=45954 RepID=A0A9D4EG26_DREPO|nr:hypothetical protein DPMN_178972 [Dreissena polymorpha]